MSNFGKWSHAGVPHKGWSCTHIEDLGEPNQKCEMCEFQDIRYVHFMSHPNWPVELECGCECAGKMEENITGAQTRERVLKNRTARRRNWGSVKGWHRSAKGNLTITRDRYICTVFKQGNNFKGSVVDPKQNKPVFSKKSYPTEERAKLSLFDYVEMLKIVK